MEYMKIQAHVGIKSSLMLKKNKAITWVDLTYAVIALKVLKQRLFMTF